MSYRPRLNLGRRHTIRTPAGARVRGDQHQGPRRGALARPAVHLTRPTHRQRGRQRRQLGHKLPRPARRFGGRAQKGCSGSAYTDIAGRRWARRSTRRTSGRKVKATWAHVSPRRPSRCARQLEHGLWRRRTSSRARRPTVPREKLCELAAEDPSGDGPRSVIERCSQKVRDVTLAVYERWCQPPEEGARVMG